MKKEPLLLLILISWIIGCTGSEEKYEILELVSKRIIEIPLDEYTSSTWGTLQYLNLGEDEYLVFHDQIKSREKKIHFAHINEKGRSFQVNVSLDGPNGVGHLDSFHVKNLDSIFVLNQYAYRLYLIDTSGTVRDMYPLIGDNLQEPSEITYLPFPFPFSQIVDLGSKLFFPARPDVNTLENYRLESYKTGILLDLNTKKFSYKLGYPDSYINSGFWGMPLEISSSTVNFKDSLVVQSFSIEDRVMVYDFDLRPVDSPSLFREYYDGKFHSLPEPTMEPDIFYPHIFSNPTNKAILFDPYRDLYYRIFSGPYPEEIIEQRKKSNFRRLPDDNEYPDRKIMVFDREFNELGVIELDKKKYWVDFIRVVKEGVLIRVQSENENKNIFEIFEVKL
ncbi:DUF4221 family protein [Algoriphagus sp. Y33]|uniref:DUF4221 family protein n=1 Tax=Algoriphagus sp. Y33 TaxID=2772483 RepID=UPI00178628FC|nr:DUF4221 family protein [Algoriphagus sp. Y33]